MRYDEVTKEYNPDLYRAIRRSKMRDNNLDKATGRINVFAHGHHEIEIGDTFDHESFQLFNFGACGGLALALHDLTDWPLVLLHGDLPGQERTWLHAMVRHPDGLLVDINGKNYEGTVNHLFSQGHNQRLVETSREEATQVMGGDLDYYRREIELELIRDFARVIVREVEEYG